MGISKDLVKLIKESEKQGTQGYDTQAEVLRVEGKTAWVHIPGGVDETPVKMTVACSPGDTVQVRVADGRAWITGNATAPPTDDKKAIEATKIANKSMAVAEEALNMVAGDSNQYFWHTESGTDTGSHITEIPEDSFKSNPRGFNVLIRSVGIALRNALTELMQITSTYIRLGKSNEQHVYIDSDSVDIRDGTNVVATFGQSSRIGDSEGARIEMNPNAFSVFDEVNREVFTVKTEETVEVVYFDGEYGTMVDGVIDAGRTTVTFDIERDILIGQDTPFEARLGLVVFYDGYYSLTFTNPTSATVEYVGTGTAPYTVTASYSNSIVTATFSPAIDVAITEVWLGDFKYYYQTVAEGVVIGGDPPILEFITQPSEKSYKFIADDLGWLNLQLESENEDFSGFTFIDDGTFTAKRLTAQQGDIDNINAQSIDLDGKITSWFNRSGKYLHGLDIFSKSGNNLLIGAGPFNQDALTSNTTIYGTAIYVRSDGGSWSFGSNGQLYAPGNVILPNNTGYRMNTTSGNSWSLIGVNASDDVLVAYGGYGESRGTTRIYGNKMAIGVRSGPITANQRIQAPVGLRSGSVANTIADKNLSTGTSWQNLGSFTLPAGVWQITCKTCFQSNATGARGMNISSTSAGGRLNLLAEDSCAAVNGFRSNLDVEVIVNPTANTTYYVNAFQNSGSTLTVNTRWNAVYLGSSIQSI